MKAVTESVAQPDQTRVVPRWVAQNVLPKTGANVESVQVLEAGTHKSAVVFAGDRAFVAEKGWFHAPRLFEVYFPEKFVIEATECPHCHREIHAPFRRVTVAPRGRARTVPAPPPRPPTRVAPGGKVYPVLDVEGIGPTFATRLEGAGIGTTADLLAAGPDAVAAASEAPPATVEKWVSMAALMQLSGIGKQYAELLVRSGVASVAELGRSEPNPLFKRLKATEAAVDVTIQGAPLSRRRVGQWIRAARKAGRGRAA